MRTKYLIIGNSAGGIGAAEAIREVDEAGSITIVSDEPYLTYSRPLISKYVSGERALEGVLFRPADFYAHNAVVPLLGKKVIGLGLETHTADLDSGERLFWQKLLLATGGRPIVPSIEGVGKKGVFTFVSLDDARAISEFLDSSSRAVVIGGGLIGISATEALVKRGVQVTVVEMKERILNTILDEKASSMAEEAMRDAGVAVVTGHTVAEVSGGEVVTGVLLDDGEEIPGDLLVVAIGVVPRKELAEGAGIGVRRGIVVDRYMATSHPDVYACGDAAEAYDFVYGENRLTPIWPNAYIGGRVAGYNMTGVKTEYPGGTAMNSLNYFGLDVAAAGIAIPPGSDGCEVISKQSDGAYRMVVLKDDLIVGAVFVGDIEKSGIVFSLMRDRVDVGDFKHALVADDFGLVSLPRELWHERLGTSPVGPVLRLAAPAEDFAGE